MKSFVSQYINDISTKYSVTNTSEYGYRTEFETFLKNIFQSIGVKRIDHDAKSRDGNKPDFAIVKNQIPILYIETKDIGISLDKVEKSDQMSRYYGYANLILTDYLEFRFYRNGVQYCEPINIASFNKKDRTIEFNENKFEYLTTTLLDFAQSHKEPIKSGGHLAKIMGGKAQRIRDNIREYLKDDLNDSNETIKVYKTIKKLLVHDLTISSFADMYSQTVVYGLFVARFHDETPDNFSRQEARDLIPNSNPLLRHFFDHIVGPNFDKRLEYIINELCEVFSHSDVEKLMNDYYKKSSKYKTTHDPVIHFYEDFLKEYDPILRKNMGAYYTPTPVVRFITKSVDEILINEFSLKDGFANATKLNDNKTHRVQVLDPAVGTGTFISAVIREVYKRFKGQEGRWHGYVHNDLLPRIHGFELMMAPYTIAHLKLAMAFKETGFKYFNRRLGIYLTNSLEKDDQSNDLFSAFGLADSIAEESKQAQEIKTNKPIMIVIGNPPYSGESSNKGNWILKLIEDYKKEPGGKEKLKERNPKWINDDYVKFLRFGQYFIEKNQSGILAFINPHGFIDNPTFRGMRWNLLKTYDKIYILNLHGNSLKKEICPDGSKDENVFDIQQGVSINIMIKTGKKDNDALGKIYYADLWGKRQKKFDFLNSTTLKDISFQNIPEVAPMYYMVPKDFELEKEYSHGFSVTELFPVNSVGILTAKDKILINDDKNELLLNVRNFYDIEPNDKFINKICYRPFDNKYVYFDTNLVERTRMKVMENFIKGKNIGLVVTRFQFRKKNPYTFAYVCNNIIDINSLQSPGTINVCPLFVYSNNGDKIPNFNPEIADKIKENIGTYFPEELFDYIYAILHSPTYREKYKEFLKIDFPRVPFPTNRIVFDKLVRIGKELREKHLIESDKNCELITTYPKPGSDLVEQVKYKEGKVWINEEQYFGNVPEIAWNFYIGGYQPAQKWLSDRKKTNKNLSNEDIEHYQKIIVTLIETDRLMKEVDKIIPKLPKI